MGTGQKSTRRNPIPFEIPLIAKTDAIKIIKHSMTGAGRIEAVQFYTVAEKSPDVSF